MCTQIYFLFTTFIHKLHEFSHWVILWWFGWKRASYFWTKIWDSSHSAASTMRPVAAARGAGPEILVEPSVFREVRPALVDWQALKNPFQKNPVFFHVSWSDTQEKYIRIRTIWSLSRPLSTNKHQPGVSNRWEIYFYFILRLSFIFLWKPGKKPYWRTAAFSLTYTIL